MKRIYNLKRQKRDNRDFKIEKILNPHIEIKLPQLVDLRNLCPPIYDQGELGSCTANAGIAARVMLDKLNIQLSRLFQYYCEREIEGNISEDGGAQIRDIGNSMNQYGVCIEELDQYDISKFAEEPTLAAYTNAGNFRIKSYHSISDINGIKQVLALKQQPVLMGMEVYENFESDEVAKTGIIPLPIFEKNLGGHAVLIVGYDDTKQYLIVRNSWGETWGDKGYFYLPYEYIYRGLAYDFWVLQN